MCTVCTGCNALTFSLYVFWDTKAMEISSLSHSHKLNLLTEVEFGFAYINKLLLLIVLVFEANIEVLI